MGSTLVAVMTEAARRCGAGFSSTCTSAGTTTSLIDLLAADEGVDESFAQGGWILRPNAVAAGDRLRRINAAAFTPSTGAWGIGRAWTNAPANGEAYYVFSMLPPTEMPGIPESWKRLVNRALAATYYDDEITVGFGDGTQDRFTIADETGWVAREQHIRGVLLRTQNDDGTVTDIDQGKNGRYWRIQHGAQGPQVVLSRIPSGTQAVVLSVVRTYQPLSAFDDETNCPLDLAALRTRYELYCYLDAASQSVGQYKAEKERALRDWRIEYGGHQPANAVVMS